MIPINWLAGLASRGSHPISPTSHSYETGEVRYVQGCMGNAMQRRKPITNLPSSPAANNRALCAVRKPPLRQVMSQDTQRQLHLRSPTDEAPFNRRLLSKDGYIWNAEEPEG
jgi:hypothetical protein